MRITAALATCVATLVLATAGWIGIVRLTKPSTQVQWAQGLYQRKEAAANRLPPNRIVIIGGSGAHYGFSGREVSRLTGLTAVNLGTHAGLCLPYLLYRAEQVLKPGDFAVLAIEPHLYFSGRTTSVLAEFILRYDLPYLLHARISDVASLIYGVSPADLIQEQARRALPWRSEQGRPETVDERGDETLDSSRIQTQAQLDSLRRSSPLGARVVDEPPQELAAFFRWAKVREVKFGIAWTPMLDQPVYKLPPHQAMFAGVTKWYLDAGGVQLGPATGYFQPIENMFDYFYHDNEKGRIAASQTLAANICAAMPCPIETPKKTASGSNAP